MLNPQEREKLTPVVVRFDDSWQLAYEIEAVDERRHTVFLPGAPDAWSGSVCVVDAERITRLDTSVKSVGNAMGKLGKGTSNIVGEIDEHAQ